MTPDRADADWCRTPHDAYRFYTENFTFRERCAIAYVIQWEQQAVQQRAAEMYAQLLAEFEEAKPRGPLGQGSQPSG